MNSCCTMQKLDILNLSSNWHFWLQELPVAYMILYKINKSHLEHKTEYKCWKP